MRSVVVAGGLSLCTPWAQAGGVCALTAPDGHRDDGLAPWEPRGSVHRALRQRPARVCPPPASPCFWQGCVIGCGFFSPWAVPTGTALMVALDFVTLALHRLTFCYLCSSVCVKGLYASDPSFRLWTFLPLIISGCSSFSLYFYWWQSIVSLVLPTINERSVLLFLAPQLVIVAGTEKWRLIPLVINLSDRDKRQEGCGGLGT